MNRKENRFYYVYSSALEYQIEIKVGTLEGLRHRPDYEKLLKDPMLKFSGLYQEECADLYVKLQVLSDGKPIALPVQTSYKAFTTRWNWNEWVKLPVLYAQLPRDALLALTVYDCAGPGRLMLVGGTSVSVFGKHGMMRRGMLDLRVWPGVEGGADTPGKAKDSGDEQMQRLAKLVKKHRNEQMPKADWLDRLTFREIEQIYEREKRNSEYMYLMIEFPTVCVGEQEHAVVYYEEDGDEVNQNKSEPDIVTVPDTEIGLENLTESKHHRLARSVRWGQWARDAKPTARERDRLAAALGAPPAAQPPAADHQDLVWKFRFYLSTNRRALPKFLECVNWNQPGEVKQALSMMQQWAPMDVEDALELLTPKFTHPAVRRYAISRLRQAPDEDLLLYLLQLVQALKYEDAADIHDLAARLCGREPGGGGAAAPSAPPAPRGSLSSLASVSSGRQPEDCAGEAGEVGVEAAGGETPSEDSGDEATLAGYLIARAQRNPRVANYLYWYLLVECEDREPPADAARRRMYLDVMRALSASLRDGPAEAQRTRLSLARQQAFIDKLVQLVRLVARESGSRGRKAERLRRLLADPDAFKYNFASFEPMPLPLDPSVTIKGIAAQKASLFKSALMPCRLTFLTGAGREYDAIFKHGDDLRQDQLVLQMITLMDRLLRRENLDLKLTPYKVLATSSKRGFLQYVESVSVAEALAAEGSIQSFLRKHNPAPAAPLGIRPDAMDTYVRSCAGYCVITYLLGVGDRHLDNLLLTSAGALFHIDFGCILGRDPKPLPPPMKLSKEMVEAMGGVSADHYHQFRKLCYTAFLHLRRHANLMLNLFSLMVDASVPDIALEPDKAVKKVQDKLRLDLGDEEAVLHFQTLLDMSVTAVMAALVEQFHKFAQYWRK